MGGKRRGVVVGQQNGQAQIHWVSFGLSPMLCTRQESHYQVWALRTPGFHEKA
jgi:hypothetical protein